MLATSATEREVLRQLPQLHGHAELQLGDVSVVIDPVYAAASGRRCRELHVTVKSRGNVQHRLACSEGSVWFLVPDVLGADSSAD